MSNKRFYWMLAAICLSVIAIVAIWRYPDYVKASNIEKKHTEQLGDYVYIDDHRIIHASRKCSRLNYKNVRSERIPLNMLKASMHSRSSFCPKCVSDKEYEEINKVLDRERSNE